MVVLEALEASPMRGILGGRAVEETVVLSTQNGSADRLSTARNLVPAGHNLGDPPYRVAESGHLHAT